MRAVRRLLQPAGIAAAGVAAACVAEAQAVREAGVVENAYSCVEPLATLVAAAVQPVATLSSHALHGRWRLRQRWQSDVCGSKVQEHSVRAVRVEPTRTAGVPPQLRHLLSSAALAAALARAFAAVAAVASHAAVPTVPPLPAFPACAAAVAAVAAVAALPPRVATLLGRG